MVIPSSVILSSPNEQFGETRTCQRAEFGCRTCSLDLSPFFLAGSPLCALPAGKRLVANSTAALLYSVGGGIWEAASRSMSSSPLTIRTVDEQHGIVQNYLRQRVASDEIKILAPKLRPSNSVPSSRSSFMGQSVGRPVESAETFIEERFPLYLALPEMVRHNRHSRWIVRGNPVLTSTG